MNYWLIKSEPNHFSIDDLKAAKGKRTCWNEIRNYQARNTMRDDMKKGDLVLFYHSNAKPPAAVGVCEVVKEAYPDDLQFDESSKYHDPKSDPDDPRWWMVDVKHKADFKRAVSLAELRETAGLEEMPLLQRGQRLSVQPVSKKQFAIVCKLGGISL